MNAFINAYEYQIAWGAYLLAGLAFSLYWWRVTRGIGHAGWRDLLRGVSLVLMFTPWYASDAHENFAPAVMVAVLDLLFGSADNGLAASLALLMSTAVMLVVLLVKRLVRKPPPQSQVESAPAADKA